MTRAFWTDRRGSMAVETVVVTFALFSMLFGTIEFGRYMWLRDAMNQIAYAGARCAGLRSVPCSNAPANPTDIRTYDATKTVLYIRRTADTRNIALAIADVTIAPAATCDGNPNFVRVTVRRRFSSGWIAMTGLDDVNLTATACFPQQI